MQTPRDRRKVLAGAALPQANEDVVRLSCTCTRMRVREPEPANNGVVYAPVVCSGVSPCVRRWLRAKDQRVIRPTRVISPTSAMWPTRAARPTPAASPTRAIRSTPPIRRTPLTRSTLRTRRTPLTSSMPRTRRTPLTGSIPRTRRTPRTRSTPRMSPTRLCRTGPTDPEAPPVKLVNPVGGDRLVEGRASVGALRWRATSMWSAPMKTASAARRWSSPHRHAHRRAWVSERVAPDSPRMPAASARPSRSATASSRSAHGTIRWGAGVDPRASLRGMDGHRAGGS